MMEHELRDDFFNILQEDLSQHSVPTQHAADEAGLTSNIKGSPHR
jgi:hypothetical protein